MEVIPSRAEQTGTDASAAAQTSRLDPDVGPRHEVLEELLSQLSVINDKLAYNCDKIERHTDSLLGSEKGLAEGAGELLAEPNGLYDDLSRRALYVFHSSERLDAAVDRLLKT